jgi:hypothetical protein
MSRAIRPIVVASAALIVMLAMAGEAFAPKSHFVGQSTCTDEGTFVECTGRVTGLGSTTFRIDISASGVADVTCTNPGGAVAPGQSFTFEGAGSTGDVLTPRNGQFRFTVATVSPSAPPGSCPNPMWTATVTDVHFTDATLTLFENGNVSDTITVPVT